MAIRRSPTRCQLALCRRGPPNFGRCPKVMPKLVDCRSVELILGTPSKAVMGASVVAGGAAPAAAIGCSGRSRGGGLTRARSLCRPSEDGPPPGPLADGPPGPPPPPPLPAPAPGPPLPPVTGVGHWHIGPVHGAVGIGVWLYPGV